MSQRFRIYSRKEVRGVDGRAISPSVTVTVVVPDGIALTAATRDSLIALADAALSQIERSFDAPTDAGGGDMSLIDWIEAQGRRQ